MQTSFFKSFTSSKREGKDGDGISIILLKLEF